MWYLEDSLKKSKILAKLQILEKQILRYAQK